MREHAQSKNGSKDRRSRWINCAVVFIVAYLVWNTGVAIKHNAKLEDKMAKLEQKAILLEELSRNLELQKGYYSSDEYQKKSLKENFNLAEEGEMVLIVKDLPEPKNKRGNVFSELQDMNQLLNN